MALRGHQRCKGGRAILRMGLGFHIVYCCILYICIYIYVVFSKCLRYRSWILAFLGPHYLRDGGSMWPREHAHKGCSEGPGTQPYRH